MVHDSKGEAVRAKDRDSNPEGETGRRMESGGGEPEFHGNNEQGGAYRARAAIREQHLPGGGHLLPTQNLFFRRPGWPFNPSSWASGQERTILARDTQGRGHLAERGRTRRRNKVFSAYYAPGRAPARVSTRLSAEKPLTSERGILPTPLGSPRPFRRVSEDSYGSHPSPRSRPRHSSAGLETSRRWKYTGEKLNADRGEEDLAAARPGSIRPKYVSWETARDGVEFHPKGQGFYRLAGRALPLEGLI
ncbi:hypothetical protein KM043_003774 [Ampulex compressa]|nr:hypothetical protein KM043_003774 [Ampulex compressa]